MGDALSQAIERAVGGVGYGLAWSARARCADALFADVRARKVSGLAFGGGRVLPSRDDVQAEITGPFVVTAWISVPRDLHATIYTRRFLVWPWGTRPQAMQVIRTI